MPRHWDNSGQEKSPALADFIRVNVDSVTKNAQHRIDLLDAQIRELEGLSDTIVPQLTELITQATNAIQQAAEVAGDFENFRAQVEGITSTTNTAMNTLVSEYTELVTTTAEEAGVSIDAAVTAGIEQIGQAVTALQDGLGDLAYTAVHDAVGLFSETIQAGVQAAEHLADIEDKVGIMNSQVNSNLAIIDAAKTTAVNAVNAAGASFPEAVEAAIESIEDKADEEIQRVADNTQDYVNDFYDIKTNTVNSINSAFNQLYIDSSKLREDMSNTAESAKNSINTTKQQAFKEIPAKVDTEITKRFSGLKDALEMVQDAIDKGGVTAVSGGIDCRCATHDYTLSTFTTNNQKVTQAASVTEELVHSDMDKVRVNLENYMSTYDGADEDYYNTVINYYRNDLDEILGSLKDELTFEINNDFLWLIYNVIGNMLFKSMVQEVGLTDFINAAGHFSELLDAPISERLDAFDTVLEKLDEWKASFYDEYDYYYEAYYSDVTSIIRWCAFFVGLYSIPNARIDTFVDFLDLSAFNTISIAHVASLKNDYDFIVPETAKNAIPCTVGSAYLLTEYYYNADNTEWSNPSIDDTSERIDEHGSYQTGYGTKLSEMDSYAYSDTIIPDTLEHYSNLGVHAGHKLVSAILFGTGHAFKEGTFERAQVSGTSDAVQQTEIMSVGKLVELNRTNDLVQRDTFNDYDGIETLVINQYAYRYTGNNGEQYVLPQVLIGSIPPCTTLQSVSNLTLSTDVAVQTVLSTDTDEWYQDIDTMPYVYTHTSGADYHSPFELNPVDDTNTHPIESKGVQGVLKFSRAITKDLGFDKANNYNDYNICAHYTFGAEAAKMDGKSVDIPLLVHCSGTGYDLKPIENYNIKAVVGYYNSAKDEPEYIDYHAQDVTIDKCIVDIPHTEGYGTRVEYDYEGPLLEFLGLYPPPETNSYYYVHFTNVSAILQLGFPDEFLSILFPYGITDEFEGMIAFGYSTDLAVCIPFDAPNFFEGDAIDWEATTTVTKTYTLCLDKNEPDDPLYNVYFEGTTPTIGAQVYEIAAQSDTEEGAPTLLAPMEYNIVSLDPLLVAYRGDPDDDVFELILTTETITAQPADAGPKFTKVYNFTSGVAELVSIEGYEGAFVPDASDGRYVYMPIVDANTPFIRLPEPAIPEIDGFKVYTAHVHIPLTDLPLNGVRFNQTPYITTFGDKIDTLWDVSIIGDGAISVQNINTDVFDMAIISQLEGIMSPITTMEQFNANPAALDVAKAFLGVKRPYLSVNLFDEYKESKTTYGYTQHIIPTVVDYSYDSSTGEHTLQCLVPYDSSISAYKLVSAVHCKGSSPTSGYETTLMASGFHEATALNNHTFADTKAEDVRKVPITLVVKESDTNLSQFMEMIDDSNWNDVYKNLNIIAMLDKWIGGFKLYAVYMGYNGNGDNLKYLNNKLELCKENYILGSVLMNTIINREYVYSNTAADIRNYITAGCYTGAKNTADKTLRDGVLGIMNLPCGTAGATISMIDNTLPVMGLGSGSSQITGDLDLQLKHAIGDMLHPLGSVITLANDTNPNDLFDWQTWVEIGAGRTLQGVSTGQTAGSTVEAGLPNITGHINSGAYNWGGGGTYSCLADGTGVFTTGQNNAQMGTWYGDCKPGGNRVARPYMDFDASKVSAVYGNSDTVQPPAYLVHFWKRTA